MKVSIEKFLVKVCGFTADAIKEITKNQGYDDLNKLYLLDDSCVPLTRQIVSKDCVPVGEQNQNRTNRTTGPQIIDIIK